MRSAIDRELDKADRYIDEWPWTTRFAFTSQLRQTYARAVVIGWLIGIAGGGVIGYVIGSTT